VDRARRSWIAPGVAGWSRGRLRVVTSEAAVVPEYGLQLSAADQLRVGVGVGGGAEGD
jgi:hypothetical protein